MTIVVVLRLLAATVVTPVDVPIDDGEQLTADDTVRPCPRPHARAPPRRLQLDQSRLG